MDHLKGKSVRLNWFTWFWNGIGSGFTGPASQFIEDAGFVKLRDVSIAYTFRDRDWLTKMGFSSLDLVVSGDAIALCRALARRHTQGATLQGPRQAPPAPAAAC